jgi:LmbE family N-acetylglucosaminyl deacetylase
MQARDALAAMNRFAPATLDKAMGEGGFLVLAPHPDDESLACGGLVSEGCARGRAVKIVVVSDGTGSHPLSRAYPRVRLRAVREEEARRAAAALGLAPRHVEFLRLPDRFVPSRGAAAQAAIARIVALAKQIDARALFVSWRHDPHCDHQAAYRLARAAQRELGVALYEYSVWGAALPPDAPVTPVSAGFRLHIERHHARKRRAIVAHRSQTTDMIADDPTGFRLSLRDLARFAGPFEAFIAEGA